MAPDIEDIADLEPFVIEKSSEQTDGEFIRVQVTVQPNPDAYDPASDLPHGRWMADNPDPHVHVRQEETLEVLAGTYRVATEDAEQTLSAGDQITHPPETPHRHWNPSDEPARIRVEQRPALDFDEVFETLYVLGQAGKTDDSGAPSPLQMAVIMDEYPERTYPAAAPVGVLKAMFKVMAPIGRLAGYEPRYTRDQIEELR